MTKTSTQVSITAALAAVLVVSMTSETSASARTDAARIPANPMCCEEVRSTDEAVVASVTAPPLALAANNNAQARFPVAAEVTRLIPHESPSLLASAATIAQVPALEDHVGLQYARAMGSLTNDLVGLEFQAPATQNKEVKSYPLEFSGQTDIAGGTTDWLTVRRDFTSRHDALISGDKATGLSFAFSRSARSRLSVNAKAEGATGDWRGRAATDFGQFASGGFWGGDDSRKESEGLRLFSWRW